MASNTTSKSSEEETITCSICQNILEKPQELDCLHSFCEKCLKNVDHIIEKGRKGILCPLCRKFTSDTHIKKDPILEVLTEAFSKYYDKNILNKDPLDKFCNQCDTRTNVASYCLDCKAELCQNCGTRHLRFEAMSEHTIVPIAEAGTHPVVNVTKYCPKHVTKPIKLSCVPCKLAICVDCKMEDHDTHKTEDVTSALASVLLEVRASIPLLTAEKEKQVEVKYGLLLLAREVISLGKEIIGKAEKVRDELTSRAMRDYNKIEETVNNFVQSVTKEVSLRENDANNSISSIDSMSSWMNVLVDMTEGPALLFKVRNERLLDRVIALLIACEESRNNMEFYRQANRKPMFRQTALQCENIVGSIQFEEPSVMSFAENKVRLLPQPYISNYCLPDTKETISTKHKAKPRCTRYLVQTKWSTIEVKSFRNADNRLRGPVKGIGSFNLMKPCDRFCFHQESLWCPHRNTIDIYSLSGKLQMSLECPYEESISALHPLTQTCMLLSTLSGLYTYDTTQYAISTTLREGKFRDVHASGTDIVALEQRRHPGDLVHVFSTTDPSTYSHSFCVNHSNVFSVMVHKKCLYVSAWGYNISVSVYMLEGQMISQYGSIRNGKPGLMYSPCLCAMDDNESLLIAAHINNELQIMNRLGAFSVVNLIGVKWPIDVVIANSDLFVLYGLLGVSKIQKYKLY